MSDNRSWVFDDINKQQAVQLLKCIFIIGRIVLWSMSAAKLNFFALWLFSLALCAIFIFNFIKFRESLAAVIWLED